MNLAAKNIFLFLFLFIIALLVNLPVMNYGMVYPEEATIYLANQTIHSWGDLLNIYLHPTWLNKNIPFFRPSGHFLIYQIFTPIFGWHNFFAFYLISFSFLALTGFFIIKLYKLLFPTFATGGFLAFSIYLMHPSLMISRMTFMHFDFAYVALLLCSLYLFVLFCRKNNSPPLPNPLLQLKSAGGEGASASAKHFPLFFLSLFSMPSPSPSKNPPSCLGQYFFSITAFQPTDNIYSPKNHSSFFFPFFLKRNSLPVSLFILGLPCNMQAANLICRIR